MHRHGFKGRKLSRTKDVRRLLIKNLATELFDHGRLTTTLPKAKEVVPYCEKLITKAKVGSLHSRRQVIAKLSEKRVATKLVDEIVPQLNSRNSGYFRISQEGYRRGDYAYLVTIVFVDNVFAKLDGNDNQSAEEISQPTKVKAEIKTK